MITLRKPQWAMYYNCGAHLRSTWCTTNFIEKYIYELSCKQVYIIYVDECIFTYFLHVHNGCFYTQPTAAEKLGRSTGRIRR